ncbi:UTP--glucose-1-phosphate uridylyltransferase [Azospirillaceae bacterium]
MKLDSGAIIDVQELEPQKFALTVTFGGQRFECGFYINRTAAMQAGRLFVQRKEGEAVGQKRRPRRK